MEVLTQLLPPDAAVWVRQHVLHPASPFQEYKRLASQQAGHALTTLEPVAKRSVGKPGRGGRKWAFRQFDEDGVASAELITRADPGPTPDLGITGTGAVRQRALLRPLVRGGERPTRGTRGGDRPTRGARTEGTDAPPAETTTAADAPSAAASTAPSTAPTTGGEA